MPSTASSKTWLLNGNFFAKNANTVRKYSSVTTLTDAIRLPEWKLNLR
jgi:hypothetical protein